MLLCVCWMFGIVSHKLDKVMDYIQLLSKPSLFVWEKCWLLDEKETWGGGFKAALKDYVVENMFWFPSGVLWLLSPSSEWFTEFHDKQRV